ncbi:MAG: O-antigen ligase family protein [Wenzhouxiangella sp.]
MPAYRSFQTNIGMPSGSVAKFYAPEAASRLRLPVLLYILTIMLPVQTSLGGVVLSGNRFLLLVLIIPLTVNLVMGRYGRLLVVDILFFLHVLWGIVALAVNNPDRLVLFMGSNSIEFIGGYVMGRAFIRNSEDFLALCKLFAGLAALTLPLALYEALTGNPVLIHTLASLPGMSSTSISASAPRFGLERVQVFLSHPIHYGLFTGILLSIVFVGFRGLMSDAARYGLTVVILVCTLLSLSSGPLLALVLQCGLILWAWLFRGTQARWLILLCVAVAAYVVVDFLSNRTPFRVFLHYATFNPHTAYWRLIIFEWGMINVWDNPVFGLGLNDWVRPVYMRSGSMDNFWLLMAVRYGIPGFLFLAAGYGLALWRVSRRNLDASQTMWQLRRAWMISMVALTFTLTTVHVWGPLYSFVFFFFGAGMWLITAQPVDEEVTAAPETAGRTAAPMRRSALAAVMSAGHSAPGYSDPLPRTKEGLPYTRFPASGGAGHRQLVRPGRVDR